MIWMILTMSALAWSPMRDDEGVDLRLATDAGGQPYLGLVVLPGNRAGLAASDTLDATVQALEHWRAASDGRLAFDVWKPENQKDYDATLERDGVSTVFFVENMDHPDRELSDDFGAVAFTQVWTDEQGRIVEVDIALNDQRFGFLTDPAEVSYDNAGNRFLVLQDVVTHELGHALGLDHSGVLGATQFTYAWSGQHEIGCDDRVGLRALYGSADGPGLSGVVRNEIGTPLAGAHVLAVSLDRHAPYASAMTDEDGRFELTGIEEGRYHLIVEPWLAGDDTLTGPQTTLGLCDALARTPAQEDDGRPLAWEVGAEVVDVGTLVGRCTGDGSAFVHALEDESVLLDGPGRALALDLLQPGEVRRLELRDVEGDLLVTPLSWSLFSPVRLRMELLDADGDMVRGLERSPLFTDETTGFRQLDSVLALSDLPRGDYTLVLQAHGLPAELAPRGDLYVDEAPFSLLVAEVGPHAHDDLESLLDGSLGRCRSDEAPPEWEGPSKEIPPPPGCSSAGSPAAPTGLAAVLLALLVRRRRAPRKRRTP